jgi:hypothetical protein
MVRAALPKTMPSFRALGIIKSAAATMNGRMGRLRDFDRCPRAADRVN